MAAEERKVCCDTCALAFEEEWPEHKTALRCGQEGKYRGRVTYIFPTGKRAVAYGYPIPAWCQCYTPTPEE